MEAMGGHTDGMNHSREWSRSEDVASLPCCAREVTSSFSNLVGEICRLVIYDQPVSFEDQHADRDCEGSTHADVPFILGTQRFEEPTHKRPFTRHAS